MQYRYFFLPFGYNKLNASFAQFCFKDHYEIQAERFFEKSEKGEDDKADTIYSTNGLE